MNFDPKARRHGFQIISTSARVFAKYNVYSNNGLKESLIALKLLRLHFVFENKISNYRHRNVPTRDVHFLRRAIELLYCDGFP